MPQNFIRFSLSILSFLCIFSPAIARDILVEPQSSERRITPSSFGGIHPGDRLLLQAGTHGGFELRGVQGITITNDGGVANIRAKDSGFLILNSQNITIHGKTAGGIDIKGGARGFRIGLGSQGITIHHVHISGTHHSGIKVGYMDDGKHSLTGFHFHHITMENIGTECMYFGDNHGTPIHQATVEYNTLTGCGWDGIDLKYHKGSTKVRYNYINTVGDAHTGVNGQKKNNKIENVKSTQNAGIILNGESSAEIYYNVILNAGGNGISFNRGYGSHVHDNLIVNAGSWRKRVHPQVGHGIGGWPGDGNIIEHNTIVNSGLNGIDMKKGSAIHNIVVGSGGKNLEHVAKGNNFIGSVADAQFIEGCYVPKPGSPAEGKGARNLVCDHFEGTPDHGNSHQPPAQNRSKPIGEPEATGSNQETHIKNGGFSGNLEPWKLITNSGSKLILSNSDAGQQDVATVALNGNGNPADLAQDGIFLQSGKQYRLTLDVKGVNVDMVTLHLHEHNADGQEVGMNATGILVSNVWQPHEVMFTATHTTHHTMFFIRMENSTTSQFYVDNVTLTETGSTANVPIGRMQGNEKSDSSFPPQFLPGDSAVRNGAFEQGKKGWRINQHGSGYGEVSSGKGRGDGSGALKITPHGRPNPKYPNETPVTQTIDVRPGKTISASAWVKSDAAFDAHPNGRVVLRVEFFKDRKAYKEPVGRVISNVFRGGSEYVEISVPPTVVPEGATRAKIKLAVKTSAGTVWIDDVHVVLEQ